MATGQIEQLAWGVEENNHALRDLLTSTVNFLKAEGTFAALFDKYFGMDTELYLDLITR
jgi:ABC-type amino acid transport substrate-binding protein